MAKVTTSLFGQIAVLPIQARAPVQETLEWKTDLMTSHNGTEYPLQVRYHPRQRFAYTVPETAAHKAGAFNTQYGALRELWGVPIWVEPQYLGNVANATTALACTTDNYDFRDDSLAFLYQSPTQFQVIEIDTVGSGVLNLLSGTNSFTRAWLMPMRTGYVAGTFKRNTNGYEALTDVTFDIEDNKALDDGDDPAQFLGNDIYYTAPLLEGERLPTDIESRVDIIDYELGKVARRAPWLYNRVSRTHQFLCDGAAEVRQFRQWLMRRAGRLRRYWEPSFEHDLRKQSTGTVNTALVIASDNFLDWEERTHIAVELDDATWLPRTITFAEQINASQVQLTLNSALAVDASRIRRISYLGLKRLDTDRVELRWIGNNVLQSSINIIEVQP